MSILSFVLVSVLLALWLGKANYKLEWGKTALVWLLWLVFEFVASLLIGVILAAIFVAIGFSAIAAGTAFI